jgi:hypothetical protein
MDPTIAIQFSGQVADKLLRRIPGIHWHRPWMKRRETALIMEVLQHIRPRRCLEWGSGHSTLFFPRFMAAAGTWLSVEHDGAWSGRIRSLCRDPRVSVAHVPPDCIPWTGPRNDGTYEEFRRYVDYPRDRGPFDFVLVDGRARPDCVGVAKGLLAPEGVVVLHDAHREIYRGTGREYPYQERFTDYRNEIGGLWVGRTGGPVSEVVDVEHQRRLWSAYSDFGRTRLGRLVRV